MQSPELVPMLLVSLVITTITMVVIVRSWWKTRLMPTLLYTLAIACFSGMALDLLLDQTYLPFRDWEVVIEGHTLWMSNVLLTIFVVGGFVFWYFAIMYSLYESPPKRSIIVAFMTGAVLLGEIEKQSWSALFPMFFEIIAVSFLIVEIIQYIRRVLPTAIEESEKTDVRLYFIGYLIWIIAFPLGVILTGLPNIPNSIINIWTLPYGIGLLLIAYAVARNPRLLFISAARPLDLLIINNMNMLVFTNRFYDYPNAIDLELMGSAMSGVTALMKEMLASGEDLHRIDHGDVIILVESGELITALLIVSRETSRFRQSLRNIIIEFETNYRDELMSDSPLVAPFDRFRERAREVFL